MSKLTGEHIVFIPGIDGTGISFKPLIALLPKGASYTVVTYPEDDKSSFEDIVTHISAQIPCETSIVIAESFGGPIALKIIASGRFLKLKALILSATFAIPPRPILLKLCRVLPVTLILKFFLRRFFLRLILENRLADLLFSMWQEIKSESILKAIAHRLSLVSGIDVTEILSAITIPCCYIQPLDDRTIPPSALSVFEKGISHLKVKSIKGPHFILSAYPDICLEIIEETLYGKSKYGTTDRKYRP